MSDEAQRWKEKYLKSIEQQDKLEKRWNARLDLLRRGLVRSSLAAEGADKAVDQCMKEMREIVRKDDMDAGLAALIPRLEKAVLDSEQRREQRVEQMGTALTALVAQLQSLPLPREVAKPLKRFAKNLEDRVNQARELPLLLSELSGLQGQALSRLEHPEEAARPGFLQRLFGTRDGAAENADVPSLPQPASELSAPAQAPRPQGEPTSLEDEESRPAPIPQKAQWTNEAPPAEAPVAVEKAVIEKASAPVPEAPGAATAEASVTVADAEAKVDESQPATEPTTLLKTDDPASKALEPVEPVEPVDASVVEPEQPDTDDEAAQASEELAIETAEAEATEDEPAEEASDDSLADDVSVEGDDEESDEDGRYALPSSP